MGIGISTREWDAMVIKNPSCRL